jgi:hypothetical protein
MENIKNFHNFAFENKKDMDNILDPYGEENWNEKPMELDRDRMISDIIEDLINNPYDYRHFISDLIRQSLLNYTDEELKQLCGDRDDEMCDECGGEGGWTDQDTGEEVDCPECNGTGYIDYYELNYRKK